MSYLLDTNVISEIIKKKPNANVISWFATIPDDALYLSALTLGEIRKGVESLTDHHRQTQLRTWLDIELTRWFGKRILNIDRSVADRWGRLLAQMKRPLPTIDSLLAATALHHDFYLVTRNTNDFQYPSLQVICPWD